MCSNVQVCRCCHQGECSWCVAHCIWGCAGRNIEHLWLMGWDSNSVCFVVVFVTDFWMFECSSILCCRDHFVFVSYCCIYIVFKCLYLYNLVTVQRPRSTRSSSLVTLARPPTTSSLRIADRSFQYASPRLWPSIWQAHNYSTDWLLTRLLPTTSTAHTVYKGTETSRQRGPQYIA